jgi:Response regulator containing a CheY-like receiver domain and an HTH DNA-binding domain
MLIVRHRKDKATRVFITVCLIGIAIALTYVLVNYGVVKLSPTVLEPSIIIGGTASALLLCYYPVALVRPDLITFRSALIPLVLLIAEVLIIRITAQNGMHYRQLANFPEVMQYIGEPNVWLRLLLLTVPYIFVSGLLFFGIRQLRKGVANRRLLAVAVFGPFGMGLCFLSGSLFFPIAGKVVNQTYILCYVLTVTYYVLKDKSPAPTTWMQVGSEHEELSGPLLALITEHPSRLITTDGEQQFRQHFFDLYPAFLIRLREAYPAITPSEEILSMLIRLNMSNQEIAFALGNNLSSIHTSRSRLRKKLNICKSDSLDAFVRNICG